MPADNIEIEKIELSNVKLNDSGFANDDITAAESGSDVEVTVGLEGDMKITFRDSGVLPTLGKMLINRISIKYTDEDANSRARTLDSPYFLGLIRDETVEFGRTSFFGTDTYKTSFKTQDTYSAEYVSRTSYEYGSMTPKAATLIDMTYDICNNTSKGYGKLVANYTINGMFGSNSKKEPIKTEVKGNVTGSRCEFYNS